MIGRLRDLMNNGGRSKVSRAEVLGARPVRNPLITWSREVRDEDRPALMLLQVPRRSDRWGNVLARIFQLPESRKIELDEMGSDVWEMCDGTLTVDALTRAVCAKYHLNRRQGEASVTAYMRMLAERRLLALKTGRRAAPAESGNQSKGRKNKDERTDRAASRR